MKVRRIIIGHMWKMWRLEYNKAESYFTHRIQQKHYITEII